MDVVLQFLGGWYNAVYILPLMICGIFIVLQLTLGLFDNDHDHELEAGHGDAHLGAGGGHFHADGSFHADGPIGAGHGDGDLDMDAPVGAGHAGHALSHSHHGHVDHVHAGEGLAGFLGVGKVPLTVLVQTFGILWGLIGLVLNWGAFSLLSIASPGVLVVTAPVALIGAVLCTRTIAHGVDRLVPAVSTSSVKSHAFVGKVGIVTSARISPASGEVKIAGVGSTPTWIAARLDPACADIEVLYGAEVIVTRYDAAANLFLIAPAPKTALELKS